MGMTRQEAELITELSETMAKALKDVTEVMLERIKKLERRVAVLEATPRTSLAQPEQCTYPDCNYPCMNLPDCKQPKQEPVAWIDASSFAMMHQDSRFNRVQWQTTLTLSQVYEGQLPLYTILPPVTESHKRKPLTNAEIRKWWASENGLEDCKITKLDDFEQVIRAVEGKHGIKEST